MVMREVDRFKRYGR